MFGQRVGWDKTLADKLPWNLTWADDTEKEAYCHFASGQVPENEKYTYMSLYHTKTEDDVNLPKIYQKYLSEDAIFLSDEQKLKTQFISDKKGSGIYFSDGTILRIFAGNFEVSHNGIVLDYKNRHAFIQSYVTQSVALQKNGVER